MSGGSALYTERTDDEGESFAETYRCLTCGAQFGICGEFTGSDEDYAAQDYFDSEVYYHESGDCAPETVAADGESTPIFDALLAEQNRDDHWTVAAFPRRFDLVSLILVGVVVLLIVALITKAA